MEIKPAQNVFVCGAGHQGISMAGHLALNGVNVTLWNRTENNIRQIIETHKINCSGIVNGTANIKRVSSSIGEVVSDFVMVTTPSNAHRDVAKALAPYVHKDMIIVLNPGRTFGAIDFAKTLQECGVKELPHIAETQTIVYTCRKSSADSATIYALKNDVKIAALKHEDTKLIIESMPLCLQPYFKAVSSVAYTSLSNVGMILHCAPVLMNLGWIETEKVDFKYYYDGISPSVAEFIEKMDAERLKVSSALGFSIESTSDWMKRTYNITGKNLHQCIRNNESYKEIDAPPTVSCRYILEDVPNGLVPIEYIGKELCIETPNITMIINLACAVLNTDFRQIGRCFTKEELKKYI